MPVVTAMAKRLGERIGFSIQTSRCLFARIWPDHSSSSACCLFWLGESAAWPMSISFIPKAISPQPGFVKPELLSFSYCSFFQLEISFSQKRKFKKRAKGPTCFWSLIELACRNSHEVSYLNTPEEGVFPSSITIKLHCAIQNMNTNWHCRITAFPVGMAAFFSWITCVNVCINH